MSMLNDREIPIGFGMALAQNLDAMKFFSSLKEREQDQLIHRSQDIHSKDEMQSFVNHLTDHSIQ